VPVLGLAQRSLNSAAGSNTPAVHSSTGDGIGSGKAAAPPPPPPPQPAIVAQAAAISAAEENLADRLVWSDDIIRRF
jgi:hypothetical protein